MPASWRMRSTLPPGQRPRTRKPCLAGPHRRHLRAHGAPRGRRRCLRGVCPAAPPAAVGRQRGRRALAGCRARHPNHIQARALLLQHYQAGGKSAEAVEQCRRWAPSTKRLGQRDVALQIYRYALKLVPAGIALTQAAYHGLHPLGAAGGAHFATAAAELWAASWSRRADARRAAAARACGAGAPRGPRQPMDIARRRALADLAGERLRGGRRKPGPVEPTGSAARNA